MAVITIILFFIIFFILTRLFALKKELKHITNQLRMYNKRETNKKIDIALFDQGLENLSQEINKLIDLYMAENRKRVNFEIERKQVIANMSHDLRTPLTSIVGHLQMAEKDDVTEAERKELLKTANKRAKRLETLLKDFFELSVIESADHTLMPEQLNLKKLTIEIMMSFYDRFQEKRLEPTIHMPEHDVFIIADESAVTRVIENLLSNALTHSDGNIAIILEKQNKKAKLIVKNAAYSLTEEDALLMFDRFYMADRARSRNSTGLGLSIAKSFMEKMNGTITAELKEGQLSIICVWDAVNDPAISSKN